MPDLIVLDVEMHYGEQTDLIHPAVVRGGGYNVLVDCGYVGSLHKIEEALQAQGIAPQSITHIILTHQDHDHVGAAGAYKRKYPSVRILASAIETPYIDGTQKSLRLTQAEEMQDSLPPEMKAFGLAFCNLLRSVEPVQIDQPLNDGEILPFGGGCHIMATPGHTPGHISLYLPRIDTIICGDAIALEKGVPTIANPQFTLNLIDAQSSMQRILSSSVKTILCYHGGLYTLPQNGMKYSSEQHHD